MTDLGSATKENRLRNLDLLKGAISRGDSFVPEGLVGLTHEEKELVEGADLLLECFHGLSPSQKQPSQEVLETLLTTMAWDLRTFSGQVWGCLTEDEFRHYTYGIAGCVGKYWVEIFELGSSWTEAAIAYGHALQRTNILRDVGEDWARGRCYLPRSVFTDESLPPWEQRAWQDFVPQCFRETDALLSRALQFCNSIRGGRLQLASSLPLLIADETLKLLEKGTFALQRTKVPRHTVYRLLIVAGLRSCFGLKIRRRFFLSGALPY